MGGHTDAPKEIIFCDYFSQIFGKHTYQFFFLMSNFARLFYFLPKILSGIVGLSQN